MISQLVQQAWAATGIYNYDPAESELSVAGKFLKDYTNVRVNRTSPNKTEDGIHEDYHTYSKGISRPTITITLLPFSEDAYFMQKLFKWINVNGGAFEVNLKNNGVWVGQFKCYFSELADDEVSKEAGDSVFVLKGVEQDIGVFQI